LLPWLHRRPTLFPYTTLFRSAAAGTVLGSIVTAAPEMLKVGKTIERVATADVSVMLLGASGTGKELLARAVHEKSGRKGEQLLRSEEHTSELQSQSNLVCRLL